MEEENQEMNDVSPGNYPPIIKRFQSLIIDQAFIIVCMGIFSQLLANTDEENTGALRGFLLFGLFLYTNRYAWRLGAPLEIIFPG
ncbi:MAG: hypothetical protein IPH04_01385 [Saprospirales bacterium]|nr:hypothetical protein [Saprospirales bacterium]